MICMNRKFIFWSYDFINPALVTAQSMDECFALEVNNTVSSAMHFGMAFTVLWISGRGFCTFHFSFLLFPVCFSTPAGLCLPQRKPLWRRESNNCCCFINVVETRANNIFASPNMIVAL